MSGAVAAGSGGGGVCVLLLLGAATTSRTDTRPGEQQAEGMGGRRCVMQLRRQRRVKRVTVLAVGRETETGGVAALWRRWRRDGGLRRAEQERPFSLSLVACGG